MLRNICLYGNLAEKYGNRFEFDCVSVAEAVRLFQANFNDFYATIRDGKYGIIHGDDIDTGEELAEICLTIHYGSGDFHIVPVVEGSGGGQGKGIIQIVIGVAIIAAAIILAPATGGGSLGLAAPLASSGVFAGVTFGQVAVFGAMIALGGIARLLTPTPQINDYSAREKSDRRASFLFTGATNRIEQGGPVPVAYGECFVGSLVVSAGLENERIEAKSEAKETALVDIDGTVSSSEGNVKNNANHTYVGAILNANYITDELYEVYWTVTSTGKVGKKYFFTELWSIDSSNNRVNVYGKSNRKKGKKTWAEESVRFRFDPTITPPEDLKMALVLTCEQDADSVNYLRLLRYNDTGAGGGTYPGIQWARWNANGVLVATDANFDPSVEIWEEQD